MALLQSGNVSAAYMPEREERGGFNFDNCERNVELAKKLYGKTKFPSARVAH